MRTDYDILIAGGGIVGTTLACALATPGLTVGLIDDHSPSPLPIMDTADTDYDLRVSAITLASRNIFQNLNAWTGMQRTRVSPMREMQVWDAGGRGAIHFDSAEIGEPCLGFIIENRVILAALFDCLQTFTDIEHLYPATIENIQVDKTGAQTQLKDGRKLRARLLVGADGAQSHVREEAGIHTHGWSYGQKAIVATVTTSRPHNETAWQKFLPTGPLAFLPLNHQHRCSIVWSTDAGNAEILLRWEDAVFINALQTAFGDRLGEITSVSARAGFPLALSHAESYVQPRLALVGDAAHSVHPLAGQGVNLGIADACSLAEIILDAHMDKKDIGAYSILRRYERWRKGDNLTMLAITDGLNRLFGISATPVKRLRNIGLNAVNSMALIKNLLMRHATGLQGDLPNLSRRPAL
ncbi:MAG TPA: UbiH/UbiF/VisC/COQ6 family ubiquinone biosynthesis hydroxylase [Acidiferrobacterales bacterium]|nr:UbiH/UbiF/VisC/COQ6 family ubiquinone biosynthesis hydroxylase [Acidiferrobacterales bacterium]